MAHVILVHNHSKAVKYYVFIFIIGDDTTVNNRLWIKWSYFFQSGGNCISFYCI